MIGSLIRFAEINNARTLEPYIAFAAIARGVRLTTLKVKP